MNTDCLEHASITVANLEGATRFLLTALPSWRIRGQGRMDWVGKPITWRHVGHDTSYIAFHDGGEGPVLPWRTHTLGVKHLGVVVDDLDAVVARLAQAGHAVDHPGGTHPHRRSVYYVADDLVQIEFVQYGSNLPAERNDYDFKP
jgi:hypothetical protein